MPIVEQPVIEGWRGMLVASGLRTPSQRALTAFLLTASIAYAARYPKEAFRADGTMRPARQVSNTADATQWHFLMLPSGVALATFLFT